MNPLEKDSLKFWTLMQEAKHGPLMSQSLARDIQLPELADATFFPKLAQRIDRELGNNLERKSS